MTGSVSLVRFRDVQATGLYKPRRFFDAVLLRAWEANGISLTLEDERTAMAEDIAEHIGKLIKQWKAGMSVDVRGKLPDRYRASVRDALMIEAAWLLGAQERERQERLERGRALLGETDAAGMLAALSGLRNRNQETI